MYIYCYNIYYTIYICIYIVQKTSLKRKKSKDHKECKLDPRAL